MGYASAYFSRLIHFGYVMFLVCCCNALDAFNLLARDLAVLILHSKILTSGEYIWDILSRIQGYDITATRVLDLFS